MNTDRYSHTIPLEPLASLDVFPPIDPRVIANNLSVSFNPHDMSFIGKEQPINSHEMSIIETFIGKEYATLTCKDLTINKVLACLRDHQIDLTCDQMVTTTTSRDPRLPRTYHLVLKGSPEAKYMLYALRVKLSEELRRINVECDTGFHGKGLQVSGGLDLSRIRVKSAKQTCHRSRF